MTPHTPRLTIAIPLFLLACTGKEPQDTDKPDTTPQDTDQTDTDTGAEELPERLPYNGDMNATIGKAKCAGPAEAVIIGGLNIAGNAECTTNDGTIYYATISGTRSEDGAATGTLAIDKISTPWEGMADINSLSGEFDDAGAQGSFSLKATPEK